MALSWQSEHAEYMDGSVRELRERAQEEWGLWLGGLRPWTLWGTLTVDPKRPRPREYWCGPCKAKHRRDAQLGLAARPSRDVMVKMVEGVFEDAERLLGHRIDYVACLEPHKNAALHAHVMVDSAEEGQGRRDMEVLENGWYSRYGFCRFSPPRDAVTAAQYAGKHLVKREEADLILSRGLGWLEMPRLRRMV